MDFLIGPKTERKLLEKHNVRVSEVLQCFENRSGPYLEDIREEHKTEPPTRWFIARTKEGRLLKVVFIYYSLSRELVIKSAFEPNLIEIDIYVSNGGNLHNDSEEENK